MAKKTNVVAFRVTETQKTEIDKLVPKILRKMKVDAAVAGDLDPFETDVFRRALLQGLRGLAKGGK